MSVQVVKDAESFEKAVKEILDDVRKVSYTALQAAVDTTAKETTKQIREKAPRRRGVYQKSWTHKMNKAVGVGVYGRTVYSKKPGLPHLLQNGHEVRGYLEGRGRSRTRAFDHIQSDDATEALFEKNLTKEIEKEMGHV